jgi:hypothetical protein
LMSTEFKAWNAPRVVPPPRPENYLGGHVRPAAGPPAVSGPSAAISTSSVANYVPTPLAQQWCVQHASNALGVSSRSCSGNPGGGPCPRIHAALSTPLTEDQKVKLRSLAGAIRPPDYKSKFLAAIV